MNIPLTWSSFKHSLSLFDPLTFSDFSPSLGINSSNQRTSPVAQVGNKWSSPQYSVEAGLAKNEEKKVDQIRVKKEPFSPPKMSLMNRETTDDIPFKLATFSGTKDQNPA